MIDGNTGKIMLIDFGIARSINQTQEKGVTAVGTMGYAPPELFSGKVEPRSDIYSLGSTMFHLLTGADPQNNPLLIFDFQKESASAADKSAAFRPDGTDPDAVGRIQCRQPFRHGGRNAAGSDRSSRKLKTRQHHLWRHRDPGCRQPRKSKRLLRLLRPADRRHRSVLCFCGAKQPIAQQGVHAEIYSRSVPTAKLVIDGTSELDAPVFSLERNDNLVGRRDPQSNIFPEVDLSKYDPQTKISRRHARIWNDGGNFLVEDLGSSNGTILLPGVSDSFVCSRTSHTPWQMATGCV